MAALTRLVNVRSLAISLTLGAILGLVASGRGAPTPAQAQATDPGRAVVLQQYFAAVNSGDANAWLAMFADNAVYIGSRFGGACSQQTPCSDRAAILQQLQSNVLVHPCFTLREIEVAGAVVTGRYEVRADGYHEAGIERTLQSFMARVSQDKITFLANLGDNSDPQSFFFNAVNAGTQTPIPLSTPRTPCSDVS